MRQNDDDVSTSNAIIFAAKDLGASIASCEYSSDAKKFH